VERMNRTLKSLPSGKDPGDVTIRRYHYGSHDEFRHHLQLFLDAYHHARGLKTLKGLTPYAFICRSWTAERHRFTANPHHEMPRLKQPARPDDRRCLWVVDARWPDDRPASFDAGTKDGVRRHVSCEDQGVRNSISAGARLPRPSQTSQIASLAAACVRGGTMCFV
jgi:hypothetical protein